LEWCRAVEDYLLERTDDRILAGVRDAFITFYFLTLELQEHGINISYARGQIDLLLDDERFVSMETDLGREATIVHHLTLKMGSVRSYLKQKRSLQPRQQPVSSC
jgi:hypothetical protein